MNPHPLNDKFSSQSFNTNSPWFLMRYAGLYVLFISISLLLPGLIFHLSWQILLIQALLALTFFIYKLFSIRRFMNWLTSHLASIIHQLHDDKFAPSTPQPAPQEINLVDLIKQLNQTIYDQREMKLHYSTVVDEIKYHEKLREATFNTSSLILDSKRELIFEHTLEQAMSIIQGAKGGSISLLHEDNLLEFVASKNHDFLKLSHLKLPFSKTFLFKLSHGHFSAPIIINDVEAFDRENMPPDLYQHLHEAVGFNIVSALCAPLYKGDELIGMISLDGDVCNAFTDEDKRVLGYFASIVGIALKYRELMDETVYLSQHDKLTSIYNRRYFEEMFNKYQENAYRNNRKFALVIMDLNYLKSINDNFGHVYGDSALRKFTDIIRTFVGPSDLLARFGGDEFVILFNDSNLDQASARMNEIFETFSLAHVEYMNRLIPIQFSYGIACCPEESMILDILVKIADNRMYQHKKNLKHKNLQDHRFHVFNLEYEANETH